MKFDELLRPKDLINNVLQYMISCTDSVIGSHSFKFSTKIDNYSNQSMFTDKAQVLEAA